MLKKPHGTSFPLSKENFFNRYKNIAKDKKHHVLLESGRGGRYSIVGFDPVAIIKGKNNELQIKEMNGHTETLYGNPLDSMKNWMKTFRSEKIPNYPPFHGGAIGYFTYDCARYIEKLPTVAKDDLTLPDIYFLLFDDVFIFDNESEMLYIVVHSIGENVNEVESKLEHYEAIWQREVSGNIYNYEYTPVSSERKVSLTEDAFVEAVKKVQNYISKGDVFQVNLSVRQAEPIYTHPMEIYSKLREVNPSPYMGYLHFPEFQIVSASPELLVKKEGNSISTRPIAGTRSRGKTESEDIALAQELIENEKERAEHVMLVDLERNDLGRVAEFGTVEVNEFMVIEKYSHVMHIVSNVRGQLREEKDTFDLMKATFPGGTITGAPKIRTMEIIEELEPVRRSLYTGSIGWISYTGDTELNIAIRTMIVEDGWAYVQAGAGIVIDSVPSREYKESLKKAAALWKAKQLSEEERFKREELE